MQPQVGDTWVTKRGAILERRFGSKWRKKPGDGQRWDENSRIRKIFATRFHEVSQGEWGFRSSTMYVRMLLIQGAKAAVHTAHHRDEPISKWVLQLREKSGWQKAAVALDNKNARILWAMFVRGKPFDPGHVSAKPGTSPTAAMMAAQSILENL